MYPLAAVMMYNFLVYIKTAYIADYYMYKTTYIYNIAVCMYNMQFD